MKFKVNVLIGWGSGNPKEARIRELLELCLNNHADVQEVVNMLLIHEAIPSSCIQVTLDDTLYAGVDEFGILNVYTEEA